MVTLLRRIREQLIAEGKVRKYLLYAFGEILLVVIGILLAIQVSNWNEDRILQESASYHLELLNQDLNEDKQVLQDLIMKFEDNEESVGRALNIMKGIEELSADLPSDLISLQLEYKFNPRYSSLDLLVNSGEIGALNTGLQNLISGYYRSVDTIKERDNITNSYIQTKYEPHIFDEYNYIYGKGNTFPILTDIYADDQRPVFNFDMDQFLSDKKLEALLVARLYQNEKLMEVYRNSLYNLIELQNNIAN